MGEKTASLHTLTNPTMSALLNAANTEGITKEEFVALTQLKGGEYVLIYYR